MKLFGSRQPKAKISVATAPAGEPLIKMRDIVKVFKTDAGDFTALKGISIDFYESEFISVIGKSGSGKSTLVNMITGIDRPTSGTVAIGDAQIDQLSESEMARWRGLNLGIVFQFYQLLPMLSLIENVILPMQLAEQYTPAERKDRAMQLLSLVGLEDYAHKMPANVSGGQQQSAAIARAIANDPPIIVADEPTGNLDSRSAAMVFSLFDELVQQGKTIIMVTHDRHLAAKARRTVRIHDGLVVDDGASTDVVDLSDAKPSAGAAEAAALADAQQEEVTEALKHAT